MSKGPNESISLGIDAGTTLWKLALLEGGLKTEIIQAGAVEVVKQRVSDWSPRKVGLTGGGATKIAAAMPEVPIRHVPEFNAWGSGAQLLAKRTGHDLPEHHLLVSLGTGTLILEVMGEEARRVSGSTLGGGTLLGLSELLGCSGSFQKVAALALQGDRKKVDLLVRDIYTDGGIALNPDVTASSFGKLGSRSPADLAGALMGLIGENVGMICAEVARGLAIDVIVFGGGTLIDNSTLREILRLTTISRGKQSFFLPRGIFCGAVGAALRA